MSLESSIQALADAIEKFTNVFGQKSFFETPDFSPPVDPQDEKPKKGRPKKQKEDSEKVDTDKNPYRDHPSDDSDRDSMIKIVRQEFARVVKYNGEKTAKNLLKKYELEEIEKIRDADISSFLTEASMLADGGKSGAVVTEITFDRVKHILTKVYKQLGEAPALELIQGVGAKNIMSIPEEKYAEIYANAEKKLAE